MAYTNIDDPSAYFQTAIYTGNGDSSDDTNAITNDGNSNLKPDFLWIKRRDYDNGHQLADSTRGVTKFLGSETVAAEVTVSGRLASFDTDGFTVQSSSGAFNAENEPFVGWQWKANAGTTTAFTESGNNPGGTRQTNTVAGFSIISYTGTGAPGNIAHGLPSAPEMIIFKNRGTTNVWATWHVSLGDDYKLELNGTGAKDSDGSFMNSTLPDATNIRVGDSNNPNTNADTGTYICYAWSPIQGYSKFGSYVGNGSTDGTFVYTGFKPAFVMTKNTSATDSWVIMDEKRSPSNVANKYLLPNTSGAEGTNFDMFDFVSNGFKCRRATSQNTSGNTFIYMAFAENPFTTSTGIPTTAR